MQSAFGRFRRPFRGPAAGVNRLLCMTNRSALAKPFCESMKGLALGRDRLTPRGGAWGADAAYWWAVSGEVGSDGVDRLVRISHHHGRVPDHACQFDSGDLVHAGDARFRPDHESAADDVRVRRHYRTH